MQVTVTLAAEGMAGDINVKGKARVSQAFPFASVFLPANYFTIR